MKKKKEAGDVKKYKYISNNVSIVIKNYFKCKITDWSVVKKRTLRKILDYHRLRLLNAF